MGGAALAVSLLLPVRGADPMAGLDGYLFALGVASGDPVADGFVIWTRLAPRPREPGGGMPPLVAEVGWEVAEDEAMTRVIRAGTTVATPAWAHSVHVEVTGLRPDRWYWYRFKAGKAVSPIGRARSLPTAGSTPDRLRFAFASCQKYETGYYTAFEHLAREDIDLIFHLGDYIYEKVDSADGVRLHGLPEASTLDTYRSRYAVYKTDRALQAAHAHAPWIVTWDDHEVSNDYAGDVAEHPELQPRDEFLSRRAAAYQAYYEHMPLRLAARPSGPDLSLYRRLEYGRLALFHVLDTRQYRTDQPAGERRQHSGPALLNPAATMLGQAQRDWLFNGLAGSTATWNVMAQQVLMAAVDRVPGPEVVVDVDKWAGYEFERRRLLRYLVEHKIPNPVVLTGDIHSNWAIELQHDFDACASRPVAVEFVGTSISSGGDGAAIPPYLNELLRENPAVKFHNGERGYVRCELTAKEWRTDYRTVPYVSRPGAPVQTRASFRVSAGSAHLQRIES